MQGDGIRLGLLLRQAHRRAALDLDRALAPLGISGRHFGVLLLLDRDGASTQRDLLAQTGGDKAGMQRTIVDLESRGLIRREPDASDRRLLTLTLTDAGRTSFAQAARAASVVADDLTADLDGAELGQLVLLLQRVARRG